MTLPTKCASCDRPFGLGLLECARSENKKFCVECNLRELSRLAYEEAEINGEAELDSRVDWMNREYGIRYGRHA